MTTERTPEEDARLYIDHAIDELRLAKDALHKAGIRMDARILLTAQLSGLKLVREHLLYDEEPQS